MQQDRFPNSEALPEAFATVSPLSEQRPASYQALEQRVTERNNEFNQKHAARLRELAEKERIAGRLGSLLQRLARNHVNATLTILPGSWFYPWQIL